MESIQSLKEKLFMFMKIKIKIMQNRISLFLLKQVKLKLKMDPAKLRGHSVNSPLQSHQMNISTIIEKIKEDKNYMI